VRDLPASAGAAFDFMGDGRDADHLVNRGFGRPKIGWKLSRRVWDNAA